MGVLYFRVTLHFYDQVFLKSFDGVHEVPPSPPPLGPSGPLGYIYATSNCLKIFLNI
jgi:hypothetical protein